MSQFFRIKQWIGSASRTTIVLCLAILISSYVLVKTMTTSKVSELSETMYDMMIRHRLWAPPLDPRIVIVDIDEASLFAMSSEFGRWPWSRDTLATTLSFVSKQKPSAIVWDILFSDLDRLSPGGDKALDNAVRNSPNNIHSVVRLPPAYDSKSQLSYKTLPSLWSTEKKKDKPTVATVAIIPPSLPAMIATPLGYNNAYPDVDGILRKYRWTETLDDQSKIQSLATATARIVDRSGVIPNNATLINWRKKANSYPRIAFSEVFSEAESQAKAEKFSFENRIVIFGATASSLHDRLPTSLDTNQVGVDVLATAIDNAINNQFLFEFSPSLLTGLSLLVIWSIAYIAWTHGVESLHGGLVIVPSALLSISFASLHGSPWFVDLSGAAGAGLAFVGALKLWNHWRRDFWCGASQSQEGLLVITSTSSLIFDDRTNDSLIRMFEKHAPYCRLVGGDSSAQWPAKLRWPELLNRISILGPIAELKMVRSLTEAGTRPLDGACICSEILPVQSNTSKNEIAILIRTQASQPQRSEVVLAPTA